MTAPPVTPPLAKIQMVDTRSGLGTITFVSFLQNLWASVGGSDGVQAAVAALQAQVAALSSVVAGILSSLGAISAQITTIFGMHGDGTLSGAGQLTVTKTNGVPFAASATTNTVDAGNITVGTLPSARIAANSVAYAKLVNAAGAGVLGASAPGALAILGAGRGISFAGSAVTAQDPVTTVGSLGAATAGFRAFVTDSTVVAAANFGNVVVGGGANFCPCYADGAAWRIG